MGKVAGAQNFDGKNWHEQHIAKRTRAALDEQGLCGASCRGYAGGIGLLSAALRRTLGTVPCPM